MIWQNPCLSAGRHAHRVDRWARTWAAHQKDIVSWDHQLWVAWVPVLSVAQSLGDERWTTHPLCPSASISQETVASVLTWATYELAKNPRIAQKVKEEVPTSPTVPATPVPTRKKWWFPQFQTAFYVEILPYHRDTEKLLVVSASSNQLPTRTSTQNQGKEDLPFV